MLIVAQTAYASAIYDKKAFAVDNCRKGVMDAIELLKPVPTNPPAGGKLACAKSFVHPNSCDLTTTAARVGQLFNAAGAGLISIAFCGEAHKYMQPRPTKTPQLKGKALAEAQKFWDASLQDRDRSRGLLNLMGGVAFPTPGLLVFERDMTATYAIPAGIVTTIGREDNLTVPAGNPTAGLSLNAENRSVAIAGYIFLCVAGGDQSQHDRVVVFYGSNHEDIFTHFEYFANHTTLDWVAKRPRSYLIVPSHVK